MKTLKNIILLGVFASTISLSISSCSEDKIDRNNSVIVDNHVPQNDFDKWLNKNYLEEYNIDVKYKYDDIYTNFRYHVSPAEYTKSIQIANLVKYVCIEPYDKVTGSKDFIRRLFPKQLFFVGSSALNTNGTELLGVAEGGRAIKLYKVNKLDPKDLKKLNFYYFHTIHHEFTHIQNQTKPYSVDFKQITGSSYVADTWSDQDTYSKPNDIKDQVKKEYATDTVKVFFNNVSEIKKLEDKPNRTSEENQKLSELKNANNGILQIPEKKQEIDNFVSVVFMLDELSVSDVNALRKGFISPYASKNNIEDFAELQAFYITDTKDVWNAKILVAGKEGGAFITQKMSIVKSYLKNEWGVDIDALRDEVQLRTENVSTIDINSVSID